MKGKKPTLLTFHEDEDEDGVDHKAIEDTERAAHEKLERHLSCCMKCGNSKFCKIDRSGNHVHLTFQQLSSWAAGLVSPWSLLMLNLLLKHYIGHRTKQRYSRLTT
jgi:hypothetical protein